MASDLHSENLLSMVPQETISSSFGPGKVFDLDIVRSEVDRFFLSDPVDVEGKLDANLGGISVGQVILSEEEFLSSPVSSTEPLTAHVEPFPTDSLLYKDEISAELSPSPESAVSDEVLSAGSTISPGQLRFLCTHCPQKFKQRNHINLHITAVHMKLKPFDCKRCDRRFSTSSNLRRHLRMVHDKVKPWECPMCDFKFSEPADMKKHFRRKHPG
eukprot:CAMPEP_0198311812 /NCGR_PEP_ID=MMETSP1450-20131203/3425_1 /TAXON_ID=753684 ORGANISM="Madagascaria erythrocladiodes, Strain CCMP3234" /NCGR_SAMPLE_ID=MMETSP1450 /ASSEMBLY_ACC=CAM_ASM_001115 /LENGTH=214 /DNA_ID=CAMNT_0044014725 /DNA_START=264 /DNA_END=904 /DNA_ORIENTATION=-